MHARIVPQAAVRADTRVSDRIIAAAFCLTVLIVLCALEPQLRHWFVIPVTMCGILVGLDALPWLRGRRNPFDPIGAIAALGIHLFFLAPLLHVYWDSWLPFVAQPADWRPWLGQMSVLNLVGLLIYRAIIHRRRKETQRSKSLQFWQIETTRFMLIGAVLVTATTLLQTWVYIGVNGITGYMEASATNPDAFAGMGWLFVICESAPIIAMMLFAVAAERIPLFRRPWVIVLVLAAFFGLSLVFGGLRGSRSNTVWAVFWAAGIVHYRIKPLSRKAIAVGLIALVAFMYVYGFYKDVSTDAQWVLTSRVDRLDLEDKTGRTIDRVLLGDLARSDIQAFELYRLTDSRDDYQLAWGRTYLGDFAAMVPQALWPSRPQGKILEGTNLLYGSNSFQRGLFVASNVYGLAGELMLNFGPMAVPFGFALFGVCIVAIDRALRRWDPADARWLMAPVLVNLCFVILVGDADNVLFFLIKSLLVPAVLLIAGTRRVPLIEGSIAGGRWSVPRRALHSGLNLHTARHP
jgi:hypothetical protein